LKTRSDIDPAQIGLLGVSQAGWIMPLAAVRAKEIRCASRRSRPKGPRYGKGRPEGLRDRSAA
jgi:hypothetical protein